MNIDIQSFVAESNRIEGIRRGPTVTEIDATNWFASLDHPLVGDLVKLVSVYQPDAALRDRPSVPGVRVGTHIAPPSGPDIRKQLDTILYDAGAGNGSLFEIHQRYEHLHPFTDGNGRSGRALWLWMMIRAGDRTAQLGFLHAWYYQSLREWRQCLTSPTP